MKPRRKPALVSLLSAILLLATGGGVAETRASGPSAWDCAPRLQTVLHLPIARLAGKAQDFSPERVLAGNAIEAPLAADYRLLRADLHYHLERLTQRQAQACRELGAKLERQLESFFVRRLDALARRGDVESFSSEYRALHAPWPLRSERRALQKLFAPTESRFLQAVFRRLKHKLANTRWARFAELDPVLQGWSDEWVSVLGREAPGAVTFADSRVAIQVSGMTLEEIEIFLFHELAHLGDPRARAGRALTDFETERYAWSETLDYMTYLQGEGRALQGLPKRIAGAIAAVGLDRWVEWNLASRGASARSSPGAL